MLIILNSDPRPCGRDDSTCFSPCARSVAWSCCWLFPRAQAAAFFTLHLGGGAVRFSAPPSPQTPFPLLSVASAAPLAGVAHPYALLAALRLLRPLRSSAASLLPAVACARLPPYALMRPRRAAVTASPRPPPLSAAFAARAQPRGNCVSGSLACLGSACGRCLCSLRSPRCCSSRRRPPSARASAFGRLLAASGRLGARPNAARASGGLLLWGGSVFPRAFVACAALEGARGGGCFSISDDIIRVLSEHSSRTQHRLTEHSTRTEHPKTTPPHSHHST